MAIIWIVGHFGRARGPRRVGRVRLTGPILAEGSAHVVFLAVEGSAHVVFWAVEGSAHVVFWVVEGSAHVVFGAVEGSAPCPPSWRKGGPVLAERSACEGSAGWILIRTL